MDGKSEVSSSTNKRQCASFSRMTLLIGVTAIAFVVAYVILSQALSGTAILIVGGKPVLWLPYLLDFFGDASTIRVVSGSMEGNGVSGATVTFFGSTTEPIAVGITDSKGEIKSYTSYDSIKKEKEGYSTERVGWSVPPLPGTVSITVLHRELSASECGGYSSCLNCVGSGGCRWSNLVSECFSMDDTNRFLGRNPEWVLGPSYCTPKTPEPR